MSKNTNISELINYISVDGSGNVVLSSGQLVATQNYVSTAITNLVNSAPSTLDTLNELATALGNDANFATTVATSIGTKQAQLNGTGFVKISGTTISYDNSTYLTTASASSTYLTTTTAGTTYVPYTGATANVSLGNYELGAKYITSEGSSGLGGVVNIKQDAISMPKGNGYSSIGANLSSFDFWAYTGASTYKYFQLRFDGLTNGTTRLYTLPNADGTLALTSNLSSYLPLAGGTLTGVLTLPASGYIDNLASLKYGAYSWASYNTSTGAISFQNATAGGLNINAGVVTISSSLTTSGTINSGDSVTLLGELYFGGTLSNRYFRLVKSGTAESTGVLNYQFYTGASWVTKSTLDYTGAATFNSTLRAASLSINVGQTSDRLFYISANLPTTGTSQFQAVLNGTFVNTATTLYGVYIGNNSNVNVTNSYALFLESTGGTGTITNKYGVYQSGGSDKNYFAGSVGVGINNPSSIFHVVVPETASNLSGVRIQGDTNNKLLVLGANASYTWIQSHGSVPLRLNELGNELIMGLGANVAIGISSSIGPKLDVRSTASYSSAMTQPAFFGSNDASGPLGMVIQTISGSGNAIRTELTSTRYGVSGNDLTINRDSGAGAGGLTVKYQGNVGVNNPNPVHNLDVDGTSRTTSTAMIGSGVGLLQFAMDGTRFNMYGYSHVHIKTSILKGSDTMINYNIRGYMYSPNNIDTDVAFYCYNGTNTPYGVTVNHKCWGGFTVSMYYSSDNYVCICVDSLSTYGGFSLNWINSSLIQWGGRVFTIAWTRVNTASAQY